MRVPASLAPLRAPSRVRRLAVLPVAALLLLASAATAGAQLVRGVVVDSLSGEPVARVTVRLVDSAGHAVGGALLGETGRFELRAPEPGRYSVHVQRVGYSLAAPIPLDLAATDTVWRRILVAPVAVSLAEVRITGRGTCDAREDALQTLFVWEEARKALDATLVTRGTRRIRAAVVDHERELDLRSLRVREEERQERVGLVDQPYTSPPAESFSRLGYMQEVDGRTWLFAPSADVLLSTSFLEEHCLRLLPGDADRAGMIGLAFSPVPSRRLPDIAGVLWLDMQSAALRVLEYRYTGLPEYMPAEKFGGKVEFAQLPNGGWVMRRWTVRAPMIEQSVQPRLTMGAGRRLDNGGRMELKITGLREAAGEILWATTTTGEPLLGTPPPRP